MFTQHGGTGSQAQWKKMRKMFQDEKILEKSNSFKEIFKNFKIIQDVSHICQECQEFLRP